MRKRLMAGISLAIALGAFASAASPPGAVAEDPEEAALRSCVRRAIASGESFDITKVEPYNAKDADLAYLDLTPMKYNNWAAYRAGVQKALFEPNQSLKIKLNDDLGVHRRGSLARATVTFGADLVNKQGTSAHLDGRWTMILEKRPQGWIVVHEHVSVPLSGA